MEGVMSGKDMLSFLDLGKTTISRHPPLLNWVRSWTRAPNLEPLTPKGWFEEGHGISGGFRDSSQVWIPTHAEANTCFCGTSLPPWQMLAWSRCSLPRTSGTIFFTWF